MNSRLGGMVNAVAQWHSRAWTLADVGQRFTGKVWLRQRVGSAEGADQTADKQVPAVDQDEEKNLERQ